MQPRPCMETTSRFGPSVRVGTRSSAMTMSFLEVDGGQDVAWPQAPRHRTLPGRPVGQRLCSYVDRRGDGVLPAEQRDLAVEVVGLDAAQAPGEALPRRPAGALAAVDRCVLDLLSPSIGPLVVGDPVDA